MVVQMYSGSSLPQNLLDERHEKTLISLKPIFFVKKNSFLSFFNTKKPDSFPAGFCIFCTEYQIKKVK
jgi:hypothetical protein